LIFDYHLSKDINSCRVLTRATFHETGNQSINLPGTKGGGLSKLLTSLDNRTNNNNRMTNANCLWVAMNNSGMFRYTKYSPVTVIKTSYWPHDGYYDYATIPSHSSPILLFLVDDKSAAHTTLRSP